MTSASTVGTLSFSTALAAVVFTPAVSTRSFAASGMPCSGPFHSPRAISASALRASSSAAVPVTVTKAFNLGLSFSMRARQAWVSSTGETSFFWTARLTSDKSSRGSSLAEYFAREGMAILKNIILKRQHHRLRAAAGLIRRRGGSKSRGSFLACRLAAGAFEDQRQSAALVPFAGNFRASGIELSLIAGAYPVQLNLHIVAFLAYGGNRNPIGILVKTIERGGEGAI